MTGWMIFGGILAVLFLLLALPVTLRLDYAGDRLTIKVRYLLFTFDLSPGRLAEKLSGDQKKKKPAKKKKPDPEEEPPGEKAKKNPDIVDLVGNLIRSSQGARRILQSHIVLDRVKVYAAICGEDAHKTALAYTKISNGVYAAFTVVGLLCVLKTPDICISPDFLGEKSRAQISLRLLVRPLFVLAAGIHFAVSFLKIQLRKKPRKDGMHHGSTASC